MHFSVLRQTAVESVAALSPLRRRVLAALIVAGPKGVTTYDLMLEGWGDHDDHLSALKTLITELRQTIGADRIPAGQNRRYRLHLTEGDTTDVNLFRGRVDDARAAERAGDIPGAVAALGSALDLWGDPPLPDLHGVAPALGRARDDLLTERRIAATRWLGMRLQLGEPQDLPCLVADIRRELDDDPLSEHLHALLMRALDRAGQRSSALEHYEAFAQQLRKETDTGPGPELRRLRDQIDRGAAEPPVPAPATLIAVPAAAPSTLPPDVIDFVGREQETHEIAALLTSDHDHPGVPIAALYGPPGVGKTALAVHVAHKIAHHFDGQIMITCAPGAEPPTVDDLLAQMLICARVSPVSIPQGTIPRMVMARSVLAGRRILLIIDGATTSQQIASLLPGTPGSAVIVTSRIHLPGPMHTWRLEPLSQHDALQLLTGIVGEQRIDHDRPAAEAIVTACGGLPLAIRLAAARLTVHADWPLRYLADRLADPDGQGLAKELITSGEETITQSVADSEGTLPSPARHAFRILALAGPQIPGWLAEILLDSADTTVILDTLTRHSLLEGAGIDPIGETPRYRMHNLLRAYALDQLSAHPHVRATAIQRLLQVWLELTGVASAATPTEPYLPSLPAGGGQCLAPSHVVEAIERDPLRWWRAEIDGVTAAIALACNEGHHQAAYELTLRVTPYLMRHGRARQAEHLWRDVLRAAETGNAPLLAADARIHLARLLVRHPDGPQRALPLLEDCITACTREGRLPSLAQALSLRAFSRLRIQGEGDRSRERQAMLYLATVDAERAYELTQTVVDSPHTAVVALRTLALIASAQHDHDTAIFLAEQAAEQAREIHLNRPECEVWALEALTAVLIAAGDFDRAVTLSKRGRQMARLQRRPEAEAVFWRQGGEALAAQGRFSAAAFWRRHAQECHRRAQELSSSCGAPPLTGMEPSSLPG